MARQETIQYPVIVESNSAALSNHDRLAIANLVIDARTGFTKNGMIVIYAYTDEAELAGVTLTHRRVASLIEYLRTLNISADRINVEYNVWHKRSSVPPSDRYQLLLEFLPGASNHD
jgi:hypothetical protein